MHSVVGGGGWVYLIEDRTTGIYKLGTTTRLLRRLEQLANNTPNELYLVWYIATNHNNHLEGQWMRHWQASRIRGEWFRLTEAQVAEFKAVSLVRYKGLPRWHYVPRFDPLTPPLSKKGHRNNQRYAHPRIGSSLRERLPERPPGPRTGKRSVRYS